MPEQPMSETDGERIARAARVGALSERARIRREMFVAIGEVRQATTMASNPFEVAMQIEDRLEEATRDAE